MVGPPGSRPQSPWRERRTVLVIGVVDELPDIPGLAERWGRDALHCAYCHADEVRDKTMALIVRGIALVPGKVTGMDVIDDALGGLWVGDRHVDVEVAVVFPVSTADVAPLASLGLTTDEKLLDDQVVGATTDSDGFGAAGVPAVFAAGDVAGHRGQVIAAATAGSQVATMTGGCPPPARRESAGGE